MKRFSWHVVLVPALFQTNYFDQTVIRDPKERLVISDLFATSYENHT